MATSPDSAEPAPSCTVAELSLILKKSSSQGLYMFPTNNCDEVWPRVYVGNAESAKNIEGLKRLGITHVLNTSQGKRFAHVDTDEDYYKESGIKFKGIPATDVANFKILPFWEETGEFLHSALSEQGSKVLVHCFQGYSRSSSTVIAYLMMYHNMTAQEATRTVRAKREIGPNDGFLRQLCQLNEQLLKDRKP